MEDPPGPPDAQIQGAVQAAGTQPKPSSMSFQTTLQDVMDKLTAAPTSMDNTRIKGWLGKGSFSNVFRAEWGNTEMALKVPIPPPPPPPPRGGRRPFHKGTRLRRVFPACVPLGS